MFFEIACELKLKLTRNDSRGCERNGESLRVRVPFCLLTSSHDHVVLTISTLLEFAHATFMLRMSGLTQYLWVALPRRSKSLRLCVL
jgi:hypothetical protein